MTTAASSSFVNIGARLLPSLGTATNSTVRSFERMGRRISVIGAEMKASMRGIDEAASRARGRLFDGLAVGYTGARIVKPFSRIRVVVREQEEA